MRRCSCKSSLEMNIFYFVGFSLVFFFFFFLEEAMPRALQTPVCNALDVTVFIIISC